LDAAKDAHPAALRGLRRVYARRLRHWAAHDRTEHRIAHEDQARIDAALAETDPADAEREVASYQRLRREAIAAERRALLDLRDREVISGDVARRLLRGIDFEIMAIENAAEDAPESPYLGD